MRRALECLRALWPHGLRVDAVFADVGLVIDDLALLHRNGLIELRLCEPTEPGRDDRMLRTLEAQIGGYATTPYHTRAAAAQP